jgi:cytochrome c551/c552
MACHAVATKLVGPAYKDVAAKYAGQKDAEDKLVAKVMKGGSGKPGRRKPKGSWARINHPWVSRTLSRGLVA